VLPRSCLVERISVAKTKISSTDLLWIFRERLASLDERFKAAPIAIIPTNEGWKAVTSYRYRIDEPRFAKCMKQIQAELQAVYRLAPD
jgi:hypothetical protein